MDFTMSDRQREWLDRVNAFMDTHVRPAVPIYKQQDEAGERWKVIPILEELKKKAKAEGLWNLFLPPSSHDDDEFHGAGLSNLEYALCPSRWATSAGRSEVFNCSAPDTGNMEVLSPLRHQEAEGAVAEAADGRRDPLRLLDDRARRWRRPTPPTSRLESRSDGDHYVINGRKWWSSGVGDPRCKVAIVMGKTDFNARAASAAVADPGAARHPRHHDRADAAGVRLRRRAAWSRRSAVRKRPRAGRRTCCSARAAVLRSRRAVSAPAASITACAPSARPRRRCREDGTPAAVAHRLRQEASSNSRSGSSASPKPASTSR